MSKEIATIDYSDKEVIATLKNTVAQGLNDHEFLLFAQHCKGTGLNPFKKEVWAIKGNGYYSQKLGKQVEGKLQIMTGLNGFYAIANNHPLFDGIETGLIGPKGEYLTQAYPGNDYIGAWAKVYIKKRRVAIEAVAMLSEYDKSKTEKDYADRGIWRTMKRIMITKCAESLGLRKAFPQELNGIYTQEEMPAEYGAEVVPVEQKPTTNGVVVPADDLKTLNDASKEVFGDDNPPLTTSESYVYNLAPKFKDVDAKKYNERFDWCKSQGGKPLGNHVWAFDHAVRALSEHQIESNELVEGVIAA